MDFLSEIKNRINDHPGQALGAFLGFIIGMLILIFGPVKTLLVILLAVIGLIIGRLVDEKVSVMDELRGLFRRNRHD